MAVAVFPQLARTRPAGPARHPHQAFFDIIASEVRDRLRTPGSMPLRAPLPARLGRIHNQGLVNPGRAWSSTPLMTVARQPGPTRNR